MVEVKVQKGRVKDEGLKVNIRSLSSGISANFKLLVMSPKVLLNSLASCIPSSHLPIFIKNCLSMGFKVLSKLIDLIRCAPGAAVLKKVSVLSVHN